MTLAQAAIICSGIGILVTGLLAVLFLRNPAAGMAQATHRLEMLPRVMADRYVAFTFLTIGATLYQDLTVILWLFISYAFMAFYDAWLYQREGHPYAKHFMAGVGATIVIVVSGAALVKGA